MPETVASPGVHRGLIGFTWGQLRLSGATGGYLWPLGVLAGLDKQVRVLCGCHVTSGGDPLVLLLLLEVVLVVEVLVVLPPLPLRPKLLPSVEREGGYGGVVVVLSVN